MPCPDNAICPSRTGQTITDYHKLNVYQPQRIYTPRTKQELVAAIVEIESNGQKAKAIGSNMSFSPVARSDDCLIETHELSKHLSLPRGAGNTPWAPERFRDGAVVDRLLMMMATPVLNKQPQLVYVEAGIKIKDLLQDLAETSSPGLALPAMGASGAQSLAGALATGTHGAEMDRQPLMDSIRAVHLVGPGGQEWWVERSNGFTEPAKLPAAVPDWCPDTKTIYDDRLFYSLLISAGRLGVIYALILELEEEYWLEERRTKEPYAPLRQQLVESAQSGFDSPTGIMNTRGTPGLMFLGVVLNLNDQSQCWVMERRIYLGERTEVETQKGSMAANGLCASIGPTTVAAFVAAVLAAAPVASRVVIDRALDEVDGKPPLRIGPSYKIMDQMNYDAPPDCFYGDQSEFFFNARSTTYLDFVDQLIQFAVGLGGVPGYVNMRFNQQSDAYIAMEQFPMTVGVEVVSLRPSANGFALLTRASALAEPMGGIPHWGKNVFGVPRSLSFTPSSIECFRYAIALTEEGYGPTFSSQFTRDCGLERLPALSLTNHDRLTTIDKLVSLERILAAAESRLAMPSPPKSLLEVARQFAPSLRMNADGVALPRARATTSRVGVRMRDLSRRIL